MKAPPRKRTPKLPKGRYARVWLSPEFLAFAKLHEHEPRGLAAASVHALGIRNPPRLIILENVSNREFLKFQKRVER